MTMPDKPPVPAGSFDPWHLIDVDTTEGGDTHRIMRIAESTATGWALGPEGPYKTPQPMAHTVGGAVQEALMHLLELGLIDIDTERLHAARGIPTRRRRPADKET